jgi:hypothetical protein
MPRYDALLLSAVTGWGVSPFVEWLEARRAGLVLAGGVPAGASASQGGVGSGSYTPAPTGEEEMR